MSATTNAPTDQAARALTRGLRSSC
jgi:hypothetical protein